MVNLLRGRVAGRIGNKMKHKEDKKKGKPRKQRKGNREGKEGEGERKRVKIFWITGATDPSGEAGDGPDPVTRTVVPTISNHLVVRMDYTVPVTLRGPSE